MSTDVYWDSALKPYYVKSSSPDHLGNTWHIVEANDEVIRWVTETADRHSYGVIGRNLYVNDVVLSMIVLRWS